MKSKKESIFSALPVYIFTAVFVVLPILYAVFLSFMTRTDTWEVEYAFTLKNYADIFSGIYLETYLTSLRLAAEVTVISVLLGYPAGLFIARAPEKQQKFFLTAQMQTHRLKRLLLFGQFTLMRLDRIQHRRHEYTAV